MNKAGIVRSNSLEYNNQYKSTGHLDNFSSKNLYNYNYNYFNDADFKKNNAITFYEKIFSETNPKKSKKLHNNFNNLTLNNLAFINEKENNSNNSLEEIKFLPNYFLDIEEALKKSNNNILELKETINKKINNEKKLKNIIDQLKTDNNKLKKENEELNKKKEQYEDVIKKYEKSKGVLENEINNLGEDIQDGVKTLQKQLKSIQEENYKLVNLNKKLSEENFNYINEIKKLKIKIKNHLNEKMTFIEVNNINKKQKIVNNKLNDIININKQRLNSLSKENEKLKSVEKNYQYLSDNYKKLTKVNTTYREKMIKKENAEKNLVELKEKYDKEKFGYICQINIWKKNFLTMAKYKLLNYKEDYDCNIIDVLKIDENYINNAPESEKKLSEKILQYFKELLDQENKTVNNIKNIKDNNELKDQKEKINLLNKQLNEEKKIRRKIFYKYLNLRGNISIMCRIRPFSQEEKKEISIDKNSQLDIFIKDKNNLIIKNCKGNNNLKKYEFDYIFSENNNQQDIYEEISPLIHSLFKGNNVIIYSYGQKKSGKGFTILGNNNNIGIAGRSIQEIFYILNNNKSKYNSCNISMNILDIYNENIYNLLEDSTPKMNIKENSKGELLIENLISISIKSYEECDKLFKLSKKFYNNSKNINFKNNDKEHYIFSFKIKIVELEGNIIKSNLIFIGNKSEIKLKEDNNIYNNNYIYNFFKMLSKNKINDFKEFNKSLLIKYLKNYIINNKFKLLLLLNLNPDINEIEQTLKTLKFGEGIFSEINNNK